MLWLYVFRNAVAAEESHLIQVTDFHKSYGNTVAVSGLTFAVQPGEILGMIGPNGAGKTTTIRSLAGIIAPTQGSLLIADCDIAQNPVEAKHHLAYVPDDPKLFDSLTVWEHLQFIASAYRLSRYKEAAEALLEQFDLSPKRDTLAQELSRGMRQKAAICCAYLHDPSVILLDEPLTGLDPRGIRSAKNSFVERAQSGAALIISSHQLGLIEDLCTHLLIMNEGKMLFFGSVDDARNRFANENGFPSLEEVFFLITEGKTAPQAVPAETEAVL